eukprot:9293002-Alexandrium_andersonii.AAC.1
MEGDAGEALAAARAALAEKVTAASDRAPTLDRFFKTAAGPLAAPEGPAEGEPCRATDVAAAHSLLRRK